MRKPCVVKRVFVIANIGKCIWPNGVSELNDRDESTLPKSSKRSRSSPSSPLCRNPGEWKSVGRKGGAGQVACDNMRERDGLDSPPLGREGFCGKRTRRSSRERCMGPGGTSPRGTFLRPRRGVSLLRVSAVRACVRAARREWKRRQERVPSASAFERAKDAERREAGFASGAAPPGSVKAEGVLTTFLFASNWLLMVLNSS